MSASGAKSAERAPTTTLRRPLQNVPPEVAPGLFGEPRVQDGDLVVKTVFEAAAKLRRQRDLGHENERRAPALDDGLGRADVDLGLSAARHAEKQKRLELARRDCRGDRLERGLLVGRRLDNWFLLALLGRARSIRGVRLFRSLWNLEHRAWKGAVKHLSDRQLVIVGDPVEELEIGLGEDRGVEGRGQQLLELEALQRRICLRREAHDEAFDHLRTEGHLHERADTYLRLEVRRHEIRERTRKRPRDDDLGDPGYLTHLR